jgi:hypothetical protein
MNQRFIFRLFFRLMLMLGFVVASQGAGVFGGQEKPATAAAAQSKPAAGEKAAVDPTAPATPAQEPTWGAYQIISSMEFGVRGIGINGNGNKFRSDHNYDPGLRLFDASLMMKSNGAGGVLFDEFMLNTFGWGNDPNRSLGVDATKTNLYRFNANYRRIDYFNSLTNFAAPAGLPNSQHLANTEYRQGDFDLTLWPAYRPLRLNLGYSLARNSGPSLNTSRYSSDEFPVLAPAPAAVAEQQAARRSSPFALTLQSIERKDESYATNH